MVERKSTSGNARDALTKILRARPQSAYEAVQAMHEKGYTQSEARGVLSRMLYAGQIEYQAPYKVGLSSGSGSKSEGYE